MVLQDWKQPEGLIKDSGNDTATKGSDEYHVNLKVGSYFLKADKGVYINGTWYAGPVKESFDVRDPSDNVYVYYAGTQCSIFPIRVGEDFGVSIKTYSASLATYWDLDSARGETNLIDFDRSIASKNRAGHVVQLYFTRPVKQTKGKNAYFDADFHFPVSSSDVIGNDGRGIGTPKDAEWVFQRV
ncbi:hypothetical protein A4R62_00880 [Corynebacterium pseudotuberculosis]|nr:hypothetical protein A4R72_00870 [Corynebacterium pseudotuberculosis]APB12167.1 hypothetical protein A4R71_00885 [Corynebacterium pseudotuberculosis]APB14218.1 hypothetical protein A4R68_00915 [Corynebacterium pseudotuberculosis]APB16262.1 hypothetical protein A4R67_00875 [Corynebacterium pseudotuberculosis]APB18314.1 hypothetical protein A4R66_00915 [Corynebacterium pseudotuberculosis]